MTQQSLVEIPIAPSYAGWGWWEAVREFIQNALDANQLGNTMSYKFDEDTGLLLIKNSRTCLKRSSLIIGGTTKPAESGLRGKFGEGYKVAMATICRLGGSVRLLNGNEVWTAISEHSEVFDAEVLKVKISTYPRPDPEDLVVVISGLKPKLWETIKGRILPMAGNYPNSLTTPYGNVLTDPAYAGLVYSGGIFICESPDPTMFGYDLKGLDLNRDRAVPNPLALRFRIGKAFEHIVAHGNLASAKALEILEANTGESLAVEYTQGMSGGQEFNQKILQAFETKYGADTIPVPNQLEAEKAATLCLQSTISTVAICKILERIKSTADRLNQAKIYEVVSITEFVDLPDTEKLNLSWAFGLMESTPEFNKEKVEIVEFATDKIMGKFTYSTGVISISKRLLGSRRDLIATLVHECCHRVGDDTNPLHKRVIEDTFADLVVRLTNVETRS